MRLLLSITAPNPIKTPLLFHLRSSSFLPSSSFSSVFSSSPIARMAIPPKRLASLSTSAHTAAGKDDGLASRIWIKSWKEATFAKYTPFAVCLASGNLKIESFRHYITQDFHFLKAFAQAYKLAAECADDDDAKEALLLLRLNVENELKLHRSFVKEWGIDPDKESPVNSATIEYMNFLLATASGVIDGVKGPVKLATPFERTKVAAYTLGATTPCARLYVFIGKQMKALLDSKDDTHPYQKWIDSYSSEAFEASAQQTEGLMESLSVSLTGEELDIIEKLYHQAMKLEIEFFLAQPLSQPTVLPLTKEHNPAEDRLVIFSDFDLTCSVVDSSAILAELAIIRAPKSDPSQSEDGSTRMSSAEVRNTWGVLSGQYTEGYEQCIKSILPSDKVEFNYEALSKALEQVSDFERIANNRVIESGVLKGLNIEDIKRAGEHLLLQDGCSSFFQKIVKNDNLNGTVHVLSYCWTGDLIRSAFSSGGLDVMNIHANEFTYNESITTGEMVQKMETPLDKVEAFDEILKKYNDGRKNLTLYIGDSVGDLLCLLQADIGIVIGSSSSLKRVGTQFGVSFQPLYPELVKKQKQYIEGSSLEWKSKFGILYTVCGWAEIHALVLGW